MLMCDPKAERLLEQAEQLMTRLKVKAETADSEQLRRVRLMAVRRRQRRWQTSLRMARNVNIPAFLNT